MTKSVFPEKIKILSGSWLKIIAVLSMLVDHTYKILLPAKFLPVAVMGHTFYLSKLAEIFGRLAFPIFCFLIIEGFIHTHSRIKYALNLFVFALISEIPWNLAFSDKLIDFGSRNVFFTLLLGYLVLCVLDYFRDKPFIALLLCAAILAAVFLLRADYRVKGIVFILFLYALREHEVGRIFSSFLLSSYWFVMLAFIPITLYNGKRGFIRGKVMKYFFYAFYPVHLTVLWLIKTFVMKQ